MEFVFGNSAAEITTIAFRLTLAASEFRERHATTIPRLIRLLSERRLWNKWQRLPWRLHLLSPAQWK